MTSLPDLQAENARLKALLADAAKALEIGKRYVAQQTYVWTEPEMIADLRTVEQALGAITGEIGESS